MQCVVSLLGCLPLRVNQALGAAVGWIAWRIPNTMRRVTDINLALCFPEWSADERARVARASLIETGKALTESAWVWTRKRSVIDAKVREVVGQQLFDAARRDPAGVLIASPHLGSWELCNQPISHEQPVTYLYRPPRNRMLEPLLVRWRANLNAKPAKLDASGIRQVLRLLRNGDIAGVLPDQEPDRDNGCFAPLFGVPANTMTLLSKLASKGRAPVLFCISERLPRGAGWRIHFVPADPDIASDDRRSAAAALNRSIETCIRIRPEQYLWSYRKFRLLPDGGKRPYR